jgi:DNA integrity scanning protein DisA with diadenylate cyclase activity/mannitol/fructose-specific phosphotransferase system IIA component (Ntr-type)
MKAQRKTPAKKDKKSQRAESRASSEKAARVELRLSRLLAEGAVLDFAAKSKEEVLHALAKVVVKGAKPRLVERIYEAILEREASVNTYVGEGVAMPHARVDCVEGLSLAIARNAAGFPYGLETDQPVTIVVLVVGHESLRDEHVHVLGAVASLLKDAERREEILRAADIAALRRLLDFSEKERARRRPRPLSHVLLTYAGRIGQELGVTATIISTENREELGILRKIPESKSFIVATSSRGLFEDAEKRARRTLLLPKVPIRRDARIRLVALMALTRGLIRSGDVVAFVSGDGDGGLDSMTVLEIGREFGRFVTSSGAVSETVLPAVLERVLTLATELAFEGREGKPVGTVFVVGEPERLGPLCQQMVMNPFRGYPEEERNILDPTLAETIKEFAAIDGAFVVQGDGVVISAGTYLKVAQDVSLPGGYGSRHRVACGITDASDTISVVVSQSTGEVTMFKNGAVVLSLPRTPSR